MNTNQESPFLNTTSIFNSEHDNTIVGMQDRESPFLSVYESVSDFEANDPEQEAFVEIMDELFDEEFEEAIEDFSHEVEAWYEDNIQDGLAGMQNAELLANQLFQERYTPFLNEVEHFMTFLEEQASQYDEGTMTDAQWDTGIESYAPMREFEAPEFEQLFGRLKRWAKKGLRKLKKAVKKGVNWAKKKAWSWVYRRLKKYAMRFLRGIIDKYSHKLPKSLQPYVERLRKRISGKQKEFEYHQLELNSEIAEFLLAPSEAQAELLQEQYLAEVEYQNESDIDDLEHAREVFIQRIGEADPENYEPIVEDFVQAILKVLKWAVRIIGRKRVHRTLAKGIASILRKIKIVKGKKRSRKIANTIVDIGLTALDKAELTPESLEEAENRALASTIEQMVQMVHQLPDHVLDDEALLESYVLAAFENAASSNLPDILPPAVYEERPKLRETNKHNVYWRMKKLKRAKRKKKCRYKKLSKEFEVELTPYLADEIRTYGGRTLSSVFRNQFGLTLRENLPVKVHLYELLAGGRLHHIRKNESIPGLGSGNAPVWSQLHPLTSTAASALLREPALGCRGYGSCLVSRRGGVGHRYYYLQIPGIIPQVLPAKDGTYLFRRNSGVRVKLDFVNKQAQLLLFLSEGDAQAIALHLRQNMLGPAHRLSMTILKQGIRNAIDYPTEGQVRVVHPKVIPGWNSGRALERVPPVLVNALMLKLEEWTGTQFAAHLKANAQDWLKATDQPADGVTICISFAGLENLSVISRYLSNRIGIVPNQLFSNTPALSQFSIKPGYQNG